MVPRSSSSHATAIRALPVPARTARTGRPRSLVLGPQDGAAAACPRARGRPARGARRPRRELSGGDRATARRARSRRPRGHPPEQLAVVGGVAANGACEQALADACSRRGARLSLLPPALCVDNAAMIKRRPLRRRPCSHRTTSRSTLMRAASWRGESVERTEAFVYPQRVMTRRRRLRTRTLVLLGGNARRHRRAPRPRSP